MLSFYLVLMRPRNSKVLGASLIVFAVVIVPVIIAGYGLFEYVAAEHASTVRANHLKALENAFTGGPIAAMTEDPAFAKLSVAEQYDAVIGVLEKHEPEFAKEDPGFKDQVASRLLEMYGSSDRYGWKLCRSSSKSEPWCSDFIRAGEALRPVDDKVEESLHEDLAGC